MPNPIQQFISLALTGGKKIVTAITSSAGATDGGKLIATDVVTGRLDASLMPAGFGQQVMTATASEALIIGPVSLFNQSGYKVRKAIATGIGTKADGYVKQAYAQGDTVTVYYDNDVLAGLNGLTPDALYFLSDTQAGGITAAPATTGTNKIVQYLGKAKSATELVVDIEEAYEIA